MHLTALKCLLFLAVGTFCVSSCVSVHGAVLSGPVINPANGNQYYLLTSQSWTASQAEALTLGGNLATISNAAEDIWVFDTFATPNRMLWIGLSDVANQGQFVWASGEPLSYTNWASGEPQGGNVENWVAVRTRAFGPERKWIDWQDNGNFFGVPVHGVVEVAVPETTSVAAVLTAVCIMTAAGVRTVRRSIESE